MCIQPPTSAESNLRVSSHRQLGDAADSWDFVTGKIAEQVFKLFPKIFDTFTLSDVVGVLLKITKPVIPIHPIDVPGRAHALSLADQARIAWGSHRWRPGLDQRSLFPRNTLDEHVAVAWIHFQPEAHFSGIVAIHHAAGLKLGGV